MLNSLPVTQPSKHMNQWSGTTGVDLRRVVLDEDLFVAPAAVAADAAHQNQRSALESSVMGPDYPASPAPRSEHQYLNTHNQSLHQYLNTYNQSLHQYLNTQPITASVPEHTQPITIV